MYVVPFPFQLAVVLPVFCVVGGGVLNFDGINIYSYNTRANVEISFDNYLWVEFAGALGALLFYVSQDVIVCECMPVITLHAVGVFGHLDSVSAVPNFIKTDSI